MALHILFSSTHSPDSQQYFEIMTGKSTFFSTSGDQGARVKCCEVCEDSWEQKAQFSLVYILKYLLFEIHCEMQHTRLLRLLQKEFQHGIMSVQHFLESALFSTSRKKTTRTYLFQTANYTLFQFFSVRYSAFSVTTFSSTKVKIFDGYHVYLPKALHNLVWLLMQEI